MSLTTSGTAALVTPALTTTFVPSATTCTQNRLTMLANRAFEIWNNEPLPVPGSTFTDCYPSQFATSYLLQAGGVTQPAFDPLVCPENYSTVGPFTSNYIACCPSGYSLANPTGSTISDRPAFGGTCYTPLTSGVPVAVTAYGSSGVTATTTFAATVTNAQAYAYPYEGFAFGVVQAASLTTPVATAASSTSAAAAATFSVLADTDPVFTPSSVTANIGDTIIFQFESGNHTVTQSTFADPCEEVSGGFDSGFMANINNSVQPAPEVTFKVNTLSPLWFFSRQKGDCAAGMTFALNPSTTQTEAEFQSAAISSSTTKSKSSNSTVVKIGVGVGVGVGAVLIILFTFLALCFRRRRRQKAQAQAHHNEAGDLRIDTSPRSQTAEYYAPDEKKSIYDYTERSYKPPVPPKGQELHGLSSPVELASGEPVELHGSSTKAGFYNT